VVAYSLSNYGSDPISFMALMIGLAILARSLILPDWVKAWLLSPSLIVICLILAVLMSVFSTGIKVLVLAQLLLLIAGRYLSERKHVNND
jgi:membrane protein implicated in regulation of membrane protease activity